MSIPTPPTDVFVWDPALTNATRPTSGHLASGYATNEVPTSTEWNYFAWMITAWCQLLHDWYDDGDVEVTSLNVDLNAVVEGTLAVNGTTTAIAGTLSVGGATTLASGLSLTGTAEEHRVASRRESLLLNCGAPIGAQNTIDVNGDLVSTGSSWVYTSQPIGQTGDAIDYLGVRIAASAGTVEIRVFARSASTGSSGLTLFDWTVPISGAGYYETNITGLPALTNDQYYYLLMFGPTAGNATTDIRYGLHRP